MLFFVFQSSLSLSLSFHLTCHLELFENIDDVIMEAVLFRNCHKTHRNCSKKWFYNKLFGVGMDFSLKKFGCFECFSNNSIQTDVFSVNDFHSNEIVGFILWIIHIKCQSCIVWPSAQYIILMSLWKTRISIFWSFKMNFCLRFNFIHLNGLWLYRRWTMNFTYICFHIRKRNQFCKWFFVHIVGIYIICMVCFFFLAYFPI